MWPSSASPDGPREISIMNAEIQVAARLPSSCARLTASELMPVVLFDCSGCSYLVDRGSSPSS